MCFFLFRRSLRSASLLDDDDDARPRLTVRPTARVHREKIHVNHQPFRVTARDAPRADPHRGEAEGRRRRGVPAVASPRAGTWNRLPSLERQSVNHGGHDGDAPGPSSMDWLMHQHDLMGHGPGGHDIMEAHAGGDDPLSSLLHMEQEGQGNNSDFGGFGDDLFSIQPANPSGIFSSSANARRGREEAARTTRTRAGTARTKARTHRGTRDERLHEQRGLRREKTSGSGPVGDVGEMETTLTRPFATRRAAAGAAAAVRARKGSRGTSGTRRSGTSAARRWRIIVRASKGGSPRCCRRAWPPRSRAPTCPRWEKGHRARSPRSRAPRTPPAASRRQRADGAA